MNNLKIAFVLIICSLFFLKVQAQVINQAMPPKQNIWNKITYFNYNYANPKIAKRQRNIDLLITGTLAFTTYRLIKNKRFENINVKDFNNFEFTAYSIGYLSLSFCTVQFVKNLCKCKK